MRSTATHRPRLRLGSHDQTVARLVRLAGFKVILLDFTIAFARKVAGFCALLTLGWTYFRLLVQGVSLHQMYPTALDPDLRQTLWVALLLIMAQGWDIPTDALAADWHRLREHFPRSRAARQDPTALTPPKPAKGWGLRRAVEPIVVHLGRFMDLCVAIANKVGAFAIFLYLLYLAEQILWAGTTVRQMYPAAQDPTVSFLADMCVYVVVLGWWATSFDQIRIFWQRLCTGVRADEPRSEVRPRD